MSNVSHTTQLRCGCVCRHLLWKKAI